MINSKIAPVFNVSGSDVNCFFGIGFEEISKEIDAGRIIWITDENLFQSYTERFPVGDTIILPSGEENKNFETVMKAIDELHLLEASRDTFIIGVGGGIVTDIAGFVASVYLRGVRFGFVPTSILAMVDAAVGGKNGVNVGMIKNQVGVIRQPEFLFYDFELLKSLPDIEWVSGFAEIIKHSCIKDAQMFQFLMNNEIEDLRKDLPVLGELIRKNAELKFNIVCGDVNEDGQRRLLNFGHTIGHAIENILQVPHGLAISIGMVFACRISERLVGFPKEKTEIIIQLLRKYHLPVHADFDKEKAWNILLHDKKKAGDHLYFILLEDIGHGIVKKISITELKNLFFAL